MGVDLFWDGKAQRVFLLEFTGAWTWDDLGAVLQHTQRLRQQRRESIGAIWDMREGARLPGGWLFNPEAWVQLRELLRLGADGSDNEPLVIVGIGGGLRNFLGVIGWINRVALQNIHFAESLREARQILLARMDKP